MLLEPGVGGKKGKVMRPVHARTVFGAPEGRVLKGMDIEGLLAVGQALVAD